MTILAVAGMYQDPSKIKDILLVRLGRITEMVDMIDAHVDRWRKLEMVVDLSATEIAQIELESFQVKD